MYSLEPGQHCYKQRGNPDGKCRHPIHAVNDFANYRVFQRDIGGTSKSVTISGTYSNMNWNRVDARVLQHRHQYEVVDWTTIDSTPGGGTFSGILTVPQGGWYNIEIRAR